MQRFTFVYFKFNAMKKDVFDLKVDNASRKVQYGASLRMAIITEFAPSELDDALKAFEILQRRFGNVFTSTRYES